MNFSSHLVSTFLAIICIGPAAFAAESRTLNVEYRGKVRLSADSTVDQSGNPFKIVGLSGVTWLGGDKFAAVMDGSNHLVLLKVTFKRDGSIDQASVAGGVTVP